MMDFYLGFDRYFILLVIPPLILSLWAQFKVKSTFNKYSRIRSKNGVTGAQAAQFLLKNNDIHNVGIMSVAGSLTDHYDPGKRELRLSQPVYGQASIAAIGVAAHEAGHAIQHARAYGPLGLRSTLVPVAQISSGIGPYLIIGGMAIPSLPMLLDIGIILFVGAVIFYLITLPVEFNASSRALANLSNSNILSADELRGAKKVLSAAAMTYVASALSAVLTLIRLLLIRRRR